MLVSGLRLRFQLGESRSRRGLQAEGRANNSERCWILRIYLSSIEHKATCIAKSRQFPHSKTGRRSIANVSE